MPAPIAAWVLCLIGIGACATPFPQWQRIHTDLGEKDQVVQICYRVMQSSFPGLRIQIDDTREDGKVNLQNEPLYFPEPGRTGLGRATLFCQVTPNKKSGYDIDAVLVVERFDSQSDFSSYRWVPYTTDQDFEKTIFQQLRYRLRQGR